MFHFEPGRYSKGDRQTQTRIRMHIIILNDANDTQKKAKQLNIFLSFIAANRNRNMFKIG